MGPPLQQSVTQPVIARYVRLSASPCTLSRAHAGGERVHAAGGQRVHAGCRSCVGKRCIVSALTRCVANINQDNRRILRLSSVGSLPLAKNAPTSIQSIFNPRRACARVTVYSCLVCVSVCVCVCVSVCSRCRCFSVR